MPTPLLSTKLSIPSLRSRLVDRTILIEKLNRESECGFFLIAAPAGYGKTTLLRAWISQADMQHTWLTLDEADNDPARFLTYLTAALCKIDPSVGSIFDGLLQNAPLPAVDLFLTPLINQLSNLARPFWLVLDDYHVIQNQTIHQVISFLIEYRPVSFRLAIATRADPPLPLSKLRARSQMLEIRLADLRFSNQETKEYLKQVTGLSLSEEDLAWLATSIEGWAAGLQMAGLSLQGREDASQYIRSLGGENRYILDFLFDEVFQRQPEDTQNFLLQTAVLERFCSSLCDQVALRKDSQTMLGALERNNLFLIALDEQREWYRYHHLFRDLLRNRLKQSNPEAAAQLHQRASAWYESAKDLENAIHHRLAAQDFERAASLIEQVSQEMDLQNQQTMLVRWVKNLPREILEDHPWLCVYRAWGDYWIGNRGGEEAWLQLAEKSIQQSGAQSHPATRHLQGHIAAVRAHTALMAENIPGALEMGEVALELLPIGDKRRSEAAIALAGVYWATGDVMKTEQAFRMGVAAALEVHYTSMAAGCTGYLGIQQIKQGRMQDAMATFHNGLRMATTPDGVETPMAGFLNTRLGDVWRERNALDLAWQYLERGVAQCDQLGQPDIIVDATICLGRFQLAAGDFAGARQSLQKVQAIVEVTKVDPWASCWVDDFRIRSWLAEGQLESLQHWLQTCGLSCDEPFSYQYDLHHQNLARVLVALGRLAGSEEAHEKATTLLARLKTAAEQASWVHETIKILVMQALNDQALQKDDAALVSLAQAVSLAEPGGYVRVFVDEGETLLRLLLALEKRFRDGRDWVQSLPGNRFKGESLAALQKYIARLISAASIPESAAFTRVEPTRNLVEMSEPLSPRELEVLRLLAQGCSNKDIAQRLVIATETVHKHLKNIYSKMDVHSRTQAVARARQLGLL